MRVIGELDKSGYKITVFKHEERISIKLEKDLLEQIYKFRPGSIVDDLASAEKFVDFLINEELWMQFDKMNRNRKAILDQMSVDDEDDLPVIL